MYGNEQVCFGAVGNVGAFLQRNENVGLPRVDYFNVRIVSLHQAAEFQRDVEVDVLFFRKFAYCSGVMPAVSGINDQSKSLSSPCRNG